MARKRKSPINLPNGKIGDFVAKERLGTPYLASKPVRKNVNQTPALIKTKNVFGFVGKISSKLYSDPKMKALWNTSKIKGENARNKITSVNMNLIPESFDLTNLRLTPFERLFHAPVLETIWGRNKLTITFGPFEGVKTSSGYAAVSVHGVVHYYGYKSIKNENRYSVERISSPPVVYNKGEQHILTMDYDSSYKKEFNSRQFCFILIIEDRDGIAAACSENILI